MLTDQQIDDAIPETIEVQIDDDPDDEFRLAYITVIGPAGDLGELFQTRSRHLRGAEQDATARLLQLGYAPTERRLRPTRRAGPDARGRGRRAGVPGAAGEADSAVPVPYHLDLSHQTWWSMMSRTRRVWRAQPQRRPVVGSGEGVSAVGTGAQENRGWLGRIVG